jgi:HSP20 family protein
MHYLKHIKQRRVLIMLVKHNRVSPFTLFDRYFDSASLVNETSSLHTPISISEKGNKVYITIELPGVDKKDVSIEYRDDVVTISGEKHNKIEKDEDNVHYSELSSGSFIRKIRVGSDINFDEAHASLTDGILKIIIPKENSKDVKTLTL